MPQIIVPLPHYDKILDLPEDTSFYDNIYIKSGIPQNITQPIRPKILFTFFFIIFAIIGICTCAVGFKKIIHHFKNQPFNLSANTVTVQMDREVYDSSLIEILPINRPQHSSTENQMEGETTPKPNKPDELDAAMTFKFDTEIHDRN